MSNRKAQLRMEALEAREVMTVNLAVNVAGIVHVYTDNTSSDAVASMVNGKLRIVDDSSLWNSFQQDVAKDPVVGYAAIIFHGGDGADKFINNAGISSILYGGAGHDTLTGGSQGDRLDGGTGADLMYGQGGNDNIYGRSGFDSLYGGAGSDFLDAGSVSGEVVDGGADYDFDAYQWVRNSVLSSDVQQGATPTCWAYAAIAAAVESGINLANRISYCGNGDYAVKLLKPDGGSTTKIISLEGGRYSHEAKPTSEGGANVCHESWVLLTHRALMEQLGVDWTKKEAHSSGKSEDVLGYLTGRKVDTHPTTTGFNLGNMQQMKQALDAGKAVCALTNPGAYGSFNVLGTVSTQRVVHFHWYAVTDINLDTKKITLRNPYNTDGGVQPAGEPDDGVVTITFHEFYGSFKKYVMS